MRYFIWVLMPLLGACSQTIDTNPQISREKELTIEVGILKHRNKALEEQILSKAAGAVVVERDRRHFQKLQKDYDDLHKQIVEAAKDAQKKSEVISLLTNKNIKWQEENLRLQYALEELRTKLKLAEKRYDAVASKAPVPERTPVVTGPFKVTVINGSEIKEIVHNSP